MAKITLDNPTTVSPQCPTLPDNALAITPSDVDTFSQATAVYCGGAGNISVLPAGSGPVLTVAVLAGTMLPFRVLQVRATNTTATGLVAVY
ncbi:spike base protein, RCAP_Rcc01079 family [Stenotrophomonas maltophilia]|uniref:spike base protein, RCAP_Rcc01079 family n=1 Tax=Stenotrophomonas maltophilia TaxID=40324 RepID=UPI003CEFF74B